MERLVVDHREYDRKPKATLHKQVARALHWCLERSEKDETPGNQALCGENQGGGVKKRGRNSDSCERGRGRGAERPQRQGTDCVSLYGGPYYQEEGNPGKSASKEKMKEEGEDETRAVRGEEEEDSDAAYEQEARERERGLQGMAESRSLNLLNHTLSQAYRKAAVAPTRDTGEGMGAGPRHLERERQPHAAEKQQDSQGGGKEGGHSLPNRETESNGKLMRRKSKRRRASPRLPSSPPPSLPPGEDAAFSSSSPPPLLPVERPTARFTDLAGIDAVLQDVRELIEYPLKYPEVYAYLGVEPPRGILLHGPPGCGKTLLANAVAGELGVAFLKVSAPEVVSGMSGESEQKIRELFATARQAAPALVFIDEVDAITPKRETASRGMERRIVAQLLTCMDALSLEETGGKPVLVIGATNRPDALDAALRRAGRFDREISLGVPDLEARRRILEVMTKKMRLSGDFDLGEIARRTPGYVGADLASLTKEAAVLAINRIFRSIVADTGGGKTKGKEGEVREGSDKEGYDTIPSEPLTRPYPPNASGLTTLTDAYALPAMDTDPLESSDPSSAKVVPVALPLPASPAPTAPPSLPPFLPPALLASLAITMPDFFSALKKVQPSAKREGFAAVPDVSWQDVGALAPVREELSMSVLEPIAHPEIFLSLGLTVPAGVLLFGPPGCGKTLLAKAIAHESGANFISVKGPELLDKYVGESERAVRQVFTRARASAPCIVFFDELDALCPKRGMGGGGEGGGGSGVSERVVNQLLTEMDGLEGRRHVFVIAATNRPELIDPAMLRPGRLDKLLYVPLPGPEDRAAILKAVSRDMAVDAAEVDLEALGRDQRAEGYSGADMAALVREAGVNVLREVREGVKKGGWEEGKPLVIGHRHFEAAFAKVSPSVSLRDQKKYLAMRHSLCRARGVVAGKEEGGKGAGEGGGREGGRERAGGEGGGGGE